MLGGVLAPRHESMAAQTGFSGLKKKWEWGISRNQGEEEVNIMRINCIQV